MQEWQTWLIAGLAVLFIGVSKAGFGGGLGVLTTPLCALAFPSKEAVGLVLPLLFGALLLVKKLSLPRGAAASSLRVLAAAAVGPRERVVLVEIGETLLVLGVAPGQVNALHSMNKADLPAAPAESPLAAEGAFAGRLRQILDKRR